MQKNGPKSNKRVLGIFSITMINMCIIFSVRGFPLLAEEGLSLVFYLLFSALTFLIPASLISSELASAWPPRGPGGVYIWTREAFGTRIAFLAVWFQWVSAVVWFPTVLSFIAATIAYIFDPSLADNKYFILFVVLGIYWLATIGNFLGMKEVGWIGTIGIIGTFITTAFIIALGIIWLIQGNPVEISLTMHDLIPDLSKIDNVVFLAGVMVIISGIEITSVHSDAIINPKRTLPKAIMLSAILSIALLVLGSISLALVVPQKDISLVAGLMEAFDLFFKAYHMEWLVPIVAALIVVGSMGEVSSWILGPSKGLFESSKDGVLPPFFQRTNKKGIPTNVLIIQALIVSTLMLVFVFMPSINSAYWILTAMNAQLYLIMYIIMFLAALVLRIKRPEVSRPFKIGGGSFGIYSVVIVAVIGALFTLIIGFFSPGQIDVGSVYFYELFLVGGMLTISAIAVIIYACRKPHWTNEKE
jgi:glutamate:GABA antiporter